MPLLEMQVYDDIEPIVGAQGANELFSFISIFLSITNLMHKAIFCAPDFGMDSHGCLYNTRLEKRDTGIGN
jgi:hypothetical protein